MDANLVVRLVIGGPYREEIRVRWAKWREEDITLIAPPLFAFEVTSAIWHYVYLKHITNKQGFKALKAIFGLDVRLRYPRDLHVRAWWIAHKFNRPQTYDAHYVALAEKFNCEFWTLDKRLYNTLSPKLPWVRTIPAISHEPNTRTK